MQNRLLLFRSMEQNNIDPELVANPAPPPSQAPAAPLASTLALSPITQIDDPYVYERLTTDKPHIRLITVWHSSRRTSYPYPPTESDELLCTIDAFEASNTPPYIALSYTWGLSTPLHTIRLNGKACSIRENLFDFLNAYGASDTGQGSYRLWIDQLCIDQSNDSERGHQVKMMGDIYRKAQFVISWLDMSCHDAFRNIALGKLNHEETHAHMITIITILFNRYFSRLWIAQEFLLAKDIRFMCGDVWIHWKELRSHTDALQVRSPAIACSNANYLFISRTYRSQKEPDLVNVLSHQSIWGCEDSRDQVYGLLGIVHSSHKVPEVDYEKSPEQVYLDTIRIMLTEEHHHHSPYLALHCAKKLSIDMRLPERHLSAIRNLLGDIRMRYESGRMTNIVGPHFQQVPIVHAIGLCPAESGYKWWYEYQGAVHTFPLRSHVQPTLHDGPLF
jgi:hypothetical protein